MCSVFKYSYDYIANIQDKKNLRFPEYFSSGASLIYFYQPRDAIWWFKQGAGSDDLLFGPLHHFLMILNCESFDILIKRNVPSNLDIRHFAKIFKILVAFAGLHCTYQRWQRQAGIPHEAGSAYQRACTPFAHQGALVLPPPQKGREEAQVHPWLHCGQQSVCPQSGHRQEG